MNGSARAMRPRRRAYLDCVGTPGEGPAEPVLVTGSEHWAGVLTQSIWVPGAAERVAP